MEVLLGRVETLSKAVWDLTVTDEMIADDLAVVSALIPGLDKIPDAAERAVCCCAAYLLKGIPQSLLTEGDKSSSTISPLFTSKMNSGPLLALARAALSLQFGETDFLQRVARAEAQRDGVFGRVKTISRCFDALHLLS